MRFDPDCYQDYQKLNELDEKISQLESEDADLMNEWEQLSEEL